MILRSHLHQIANEMGCELNKKNKRFQVKFSHALAAEILCRSNSRGKIAEWVNHMVNGPSATKNVDCHLEAYESPRNLKSRKRQFKFSCIEI
jgi:hypothetical protein